jgi:hypothetical protein
MKPNRIIKLNLESRIKELVYNNKSEREIASILSRESKQAITQSSVHRYLSAQDQLKQQVVENNNKLQAKVIELELDTVQARHELIREIRDLAQQAKESGDLKTALIGLDKAVAAIDSLDKRLGRFTGQPETQVNVMIQQNQQFNEFMKVVLEEVNDDTKARIAAKLRQAVLS